MDNLIEKIITVNSVTNLNPTDPKPINFKDENGDKYVLWKNKSDKTPSLAYQMFQSLPYGGDGATIGIAYVEQPSSFVNKEGKEINFTQRVVRVVKKPSEVRTENQVPNTPKTVATPPVKKEWEDNTIFGKCKTLYLVEAFKAHLGNPNIKLSEIEKIAEEWAKASMRILPAQNTSQSLEQSLASQGVELPTIQQDEPDLSSIPF